MKRERGFVLIAVMMALVLVAAIALMLTTEGAVEADRTGRGTQALQADYLAQAALRHAIWQNDANVCRGDFTVPTTTLGAHSYVANVSGGGTTTAYSLSADQDSWIRDDQPTTNNGGDSSLHIKESQVEQPLYRFDLSSLPAGAQINSAVASFYVSGEHPEGPVTVHRITGAWNEGDVTWDSISGSVDSQVLDTIPAQPDNAVRVQVNLTAQVQAWVNGEPNNGILLASTAPGIHAQYASREAAGGEQPRLDVVVGAAPASPVSITATGTLDSGVTRTLSRPAARAVQPPSTLVLQPDGAAGTDAYIWEWTKTTNYGTDDETWVSLANNSTSRSLFTFNLTGVPAGSKILSATLSLHHESGNNPDVPITAHRISNPWNEAFVTWNRRDNGINWDTAGGDFDAAVVSTTDVGPASNTRYEWEIAGLVQDWIDGAPNYGVALATARPNSIGERFYTSDETDPTRRPRLTITYACECGSACMAPQGAGNVLMVVVNPTTLVPADATKKALFESWGYTVNVISESANAATYASEAANNDVVFISETVNSNQVGTKLVDLSVGVVSQDGDYNSDLGFAGGSSWPVSPVISVTNASHYITSIFPAGPLDIYSGGMEQLTVSGGTAAGLQTLATTSGAGSLVVLDAGAITNGGSPAAGRRVMLPLGRGAGLNWDYLSNNGLLLVQRALAWGMGATIGGGGNNVLLVVGDPANLTPEQADKKAFMEGWNHTVSLVATSSSQADIDAAAAAVDVVYIPELGSTPMNELGTKADNLTTAVITEEARRTVMLGSFALLPFVETDTINITDNSHYITETLAVGPVQLSTAVQSMWVLKGTLAVDLHVLGQLNGTEPGLAYLEEGELRNDSTPAPARRVKLPWGAYNFDVSLLTSEGLTIMQRAIEWAAQEAAVTGPIAHWKLDDGTGLTAVDSEGGHDGTLAGGGPVWVAGQLGDALDFNGANDYVDLTSDAALDDVFVGGATVMAWIEPAGWGGSGYGRIFDKSSSPSSTGDGWAIRLNNDNGGLNFGQGFTGGRGWWRFAESSINFSTWHHVALAYDASSTANDPIVYLDGSPVAFTRVDTPSGDLRSDASINLRLGGHASALAQNVFDGKIDDARIYDRMLSAAEIADIAAGGGGTLSGTFLDELNAIAYDGNDGTLDWSNDWQETGESDGPGSGDFSVVSNSWCASGNCIQIREDRASTRRLSREADLTGAASATLSLNYRRRHVGTPTGGTITLEISDNGGASFTPLRVYQIDTQDSAQQADSFDISSYIAPNTQIRFSTSNVVYETALYVDNVLIDTTGDGGGGGGGGGGGPAPVFESFEEYIDPDNSSAAISVSKPAGTAAGDLLVAVVVTNRNNESTLVADDAGWNLLTVDRQQSSSTTGVWWKLAGASEPSNYGFSWDAANPGRSYSWIMRFSGNDPTNPINVWDKLGDGGSTTPPSPAVTTTVDDTLILRIGGFDDDDITIGDPGMAGHTPITMQKSNTGTGTVSGGAAYVEQAASGNSGTANFTLTASEQSRTITIGIAPAP